MTFCYPYLPNPHSLHKTCARLLDRIIYFVIFLARYILGAPKTTLSLPAIKRVKTKARDTALMESCALK